MDGTQPNGIHDFDLDDVEAHGLKEIAAAGGAAALLAGAGAGAALAAQNTSSAAPSGPVAKIAKKAADTAKPITDKWRDTHRPDSGQADQIAPSGTTVQTNGTADQPHMGGPAAMPVETPVQKVVKAAKSPTKTVKGVTDKVTDSSAIADSVREKVQQLANYQPPPPSL